MVHPTGDPSSARCGVPLPEFPPSPFRLSHVTLSMFQSSLRSPEHPHSVFYREGLLCCMKHPSTVPVQNTLTKCSFNPSCQGFSSPGSGVSGAVWCCQTREFVLGLNPSGQATMDSAARFTGPTTGRQVPVWKGHLTPARLDSTWPGTWRTSLNSHSPWLHLNARGGWCLGRAWKEGTAARHPQGPGVLLRDTLPSQRGSSAALLPLPGSLAGTRGWLSGPAVFSCFTDSSSHMPVSGSGSSAWGMIRAKDGAIEGVIIEGRKLIVLNLA